MAGVKGKSGGKRANSGRKSIVLSDKMRKRVALELSRAEKEHGKSMERVLVDLAHGIGEDIRVADQIRAAQLVIQTQLVKEDHSTVEKTVTHAAPVLLPVLRDNPGKIDYEAEPIHAETEDLH